ncbi:hypothetical protein B5M42_023405 [Paenibacillus athensensis]|uniref:Uncharacterized protein n=1 Tax=Paenibacillus athensensis TaxID=1967502 RepID=A0A4Y8PTL8_9BACL|nr:hypothetical protein [Paenibacillus athensensis]MCD1261748.1 hypothetical protein [Paenibacillus athensensis]
MNANLFYVIFTVILLAGLAGTLMVGFSKKNRDGDQTYFQKTGAKWVRLTSLYVVAIACGVAALIAFVKGWL